MLSALEYLTRVRTFVAEELYSPRRRTASWPNFVLFIVGKGARINATGLLPLQDPAVGGRGHGWTFAGPGTDALRGKVSPWYSEYVLQYHGT